jgi:hypothetical protein
VTVQTGFRVEAAEEPAEDLDLPNWPFGLSDLGSWANGTRTDEASTTTNERPVPGSSAGEEGRANQDDGSSDDGTEHDITRCGALAPCSVCWLDVTKFCYQRRVRRRQVTDGDQNVDGPGLTGGSP